MSGRLVIRNRSRYSSEDVRSLVKFAVQEVDMRGVCVNVKNARVGFRGMAYEGVPYISNAPASAEHLVTLGVGPPDAFPIRGQKYSESCGPRFPVYDLEDWREALVHVAAHEAKHIEQFRERLRRSEVACEHFAAYMLRRYRMECA